MKKLKNRFLDYIDSMGAAKRRKTIYIMIGVLFVCFIINIILVFKKEHKIIPDKQFELIEKEYTIQEQKKVKANQLFYELTELTNRIDSLINKDELTTIDSLEILQLREDYDNLMIRLENEKGSY